MTGREVDNMLSEKVFVIGMAFLSSLFERIERITQDDTISKHWYVALSDLDDETFKKAIYEIAKTHKFAPTIAEILDVAWNIKNPDVLTPEQAWEIVYNDLHRYGFYKQPKYDNPILERAKNSISWDALCNATVDNIGVFRRQFMDIYSSLLGTQKYAEVTNDNSKLEAVEKLKKHLAQSEFSKQLGGGENDEKQGDEDL